MFLGYTKSLLARKMSKVAVGSWKAVEMQKWHKSNLSKIIIETYLNVRLFFVIIPRLPNKPDHRLSFAIPLPFLYNFIDWVDKTLTCTNLILGGGHLSWWHQNLLPTHKNARIDNLSVLRGRIGIKTKNCLQGRWVNVNLVHVVEGVCCSDITSRVDISDRRAS